MPFLYLSTDQVATFIELARCGSLRHAAAAQTAIKARSRSPFVVFPLLDSILPHHALAVRVCRSRSPSPETPASWISSTACSTKAKPLVVASGVRPIVVQQASLSGKFKKPWDAPLGLRTVDI
jgi:hypothetical protein